METSTHTFTSGLEKIAEFLYRPEILNHEDVVYMAFSRCTGVFEDNASGSYIHLEFTDDEKVSTILFSLRGPDGILHRWVRKFQDDFDATITEATRHCT